MINNKKILSTLLISTFIFSSTPITANATNSIEITEHNRTETQTSLIIDTENINSIRLPNGNWVSSENATYTVNRNGTYDFMLETNDGEFLKESYTVSELRKNLFVTNDRNVSLSLSSDDVLSGMGYMKFKNETNAWSSYENYSTSKSWSLSEAEGLKTVYVMFKDIAGNEATQIFDQIYLDLSPPEITKFTINDGDEYTKYQNVTLNVSAIDTYSDVDHLLISNNNVNWTKTDYAEDIPWSLTPNAQEKTVYLKAVDSLGNTSGVTTATIYYDNVLPTGTVTINNGDALTNSRDVKLQLSFNDAHTGVKRVTIHEDDKSYTFPVVPNSPTEIDWSLSMGATGQVTIEIEDMAGNIYRADSNEIVIASLEITRFRLTDVVNPIDFPENSFEPIEWDFMPQPMLSGANIEFDILYNLDLDGNTTSTIASQYVLEIIGDDYYEKVTLPYDTTILNGFKNTFKIPSDAPNDAKVYISTKLTAYLETSTKEFTNEAFFPGEDEKALIGTIVGNIEETIKFNEIN